jgi:hypothetical protein
MLETRRTDSQLKSLNDAEKYHVMNSLSKIRADSDRLNISITVFDHSLMQSCDFGLYLARYCTAYPEN